jgi:hypothetical protein
MRMPCSPFLTFRPSWFHAYRPATRVASGFCRAISKNVAKAVIVKPAHCGEVGGESFGVSLLQLLDQGLHVGRDYFFRGLLLLRLVGVRVDVLTVFAVLMAALLMGVSPLSLLLNGRAVVVHTTTPWPRPTPAGVATARGGESPRACNGAQREWKAPWSAQTEHKRSAEDWGTPCGREGRSPLGRVFAVAVRQGQALRTGHRSARGVAQDAPFFTAARLERRAGATGPGCSTQGRPECPRKGGARAAGGAAPGTGTSNQGSGSSGTEGPRAGCTGGDCAKG